MELAEGWKEKANGAWEEIPVGDVPEGNGGPVKCSSQKTPELSHCSSSCSFSPPVAHKHKDVILLFFLLKIVFKISECETIVFGLLER